MDHIFGDSHDIAFGAPSKGQKDNTERDTPRKPQAPIKPTYSRSRGTSPRGEHTPPRRTETIHRDPTEVTPPNLGEVPSLTRLITSMKSSFLPKEDDTSVVRLITLSASTQKDPLMLVTRDDETILLGSGFDTTIRAGKEYPTFPDMRLIFSEREHISAWILTDETIDITPFLSILPTLGFPPIYATRGVITKFREKITDMKFLGRCRFFELFAGGVSERRIGTFEISLATCEGTSCLALRTSGVQVGIGHIGFVGVSDSTIVPEQILAKNGESFVLGSETFVSGEILLLRGRNITKHTLKYTFDTFYIDGNSVGVVAGYTLPDREQLAENGILTFTLEEDMRARTIAGHIFIDSRGFVHAYEMMAVHKEILKGIRATYEKLILDNQRIERGELVQSLRREITKYCYVLTGRTPVVMPIVIER